MPPKQARGPTTLHTSPVLHALGMQRSPAQCHPAARDPATSAPAPGPNCYHGRTPPPQPERTPSDAPHPPQGPQPPRHTCSPPPPPPPHHNPPSFTKHTSASPGQPRRPGACRVPPPPQECSTRTPGPGTAPRPPLPAQPPDLGDAGYRPRPNPEPSAPPPQGNHGVGSTPTPTGTNTKPPPEQGGPDPHSEGPLVTRSPAAPPAGLLTLRVI
ncbi:basic salivary proline-rich protein 1-like [Sphaeramia orbicularis]|uniref:basic salivary proline-rich protein 1-like n=1 Tax=Sphaeramia orbicularis TaxID=375764 RepID=UPI00117F67A4|nr:basic salivary proline-rich protein 1-like [Sphaeramia orbicularis]